MKRRLGAVAVAGLAVLTTLASCDLFPRVCTEVGADSGVFFGDIGSGVFPPGVLGEASEEPVYHVLACAADECEEWEGRPSGAPWIQVLLPDLTGPTTVTASLTITDTATGEVVFDASTPVALAVVQPNGPRCPPTAFQGHVAPTRDGSLVPLAVPE